MSNVSFCKVNETEYEAVLSNAANICSSSLVSLSLALLQVARFLRKKSDLKQFLCFFSLLKTSFHVQIWEWITFSTYLLTKHNEAHANKNWKEWKEGVKTPVRVFFHFSW